jgi:hypothetical protein
MTTAVQPAAPRVRPIHPSAVVELTLAERTDVRELRDSACRTPAPDETEEILRHRLHFHGLPERIRNAVTRFGASGNEDGALLIRGFPVDAAELIPTPTTPFAVTPREVAGSRFALLAVGGGLGEPVSYVQEQDGVLCRDIFPTELYANALSSQSYAIVLDYHTELAFHPHAPDFLLLFGLRSDHDRVATTLVSSIRRFAARLTPEVRDVLFRPEFFTTIDLSFGNRDAAEGDGVIVPVLYGDRYDPYLCFDLDLMTGVNPRAQAALDRLRQLVRHSERGVVLTAGDLLVVDNRRAVHGRTPFAPSLRGDDRWLRRLCVVRDLAPCSADLVRGTHIIATDFSHALVRRAFGGPT